MSANHSKANDLNSTKNNIEMESKQVRKDSVNDKEDKDFESEVDIKICNRFKGVFRSFNENTVKKSWRRRSVGDEIADIKLQDTEISRSQYSLVSCGDLTPEAVQVWLGLPEEVKYDPALSQFRQLYDKEYGKDNEPKSPSKRSHRLPLVKSAPHLHKSLVVIAEDKHGKDEIVNENGDVKINIPEYKNRESKVRKKVAVAKYYTKMTIILTCWVFFTTIFLMYNEKEQVIRYSSVAPGETKNYIYQIPKRTFTILVKLSGPFLSENQQGQLNSCQILSSNTMVVWLEQWTLKNDTIYVTEDNVIHREVSQNWTIVLKAEKNLDFSEGETRSTFLQIQNNSSVNASAYPTNKVYSLRMCTTASRTTPFTLNYTLNPLDSRTGVIYACLLLFGLYFLIIFEIINRTMAAVLLSTTSLAVLALAGERPSVVEIISWLDVETLLLLFSMMLLVAITAETGMFDFLAVYTFEVTKGKLWPLITLLSAITALLSTFLDNVTTVLLMTPITIRLCEVMDLNPIPVLMSMVLFSNIGGTATPVGDPPNVIIASNKAVVAAGINFTNFTLHMTIGTLLVAIQTYFQLRFMFRDIEKLRLNVPREIQDIRHQISIWRRATDSLPHLSKDQLIVRERLERKVTKLTAQLEIMVKESNKRACPKETFDSTLAELKEKYKIRDNVLLIKSTVAIAFVVLIFFLHSIPEFNCVSLGWTALLGAILLLLLSDRDDIVPILHRVEWSTLLFFAALFVLMEALSKLGLIEVVGDLTETIILGVDEGSRLTVALLLILWVSGITSAFVDNIPLTTMMVRVVTSLGSKPNLDLPMAPLIWALSFGACLGGNGTLIGASANVVCAGVVEQHGYKFTFVEFFKIGFPIMIGHLIVASGYLLVCHCVFNWH